MPVRVQVFASLFFHLLGVLIVNHRKHTSVGSAGWRMRK
jgi:hypothetical protein